MNLTNSQIEAEKRLEWLVSPVSTATFYSDFFERKPLFIHRNEPSYFADIYERSDIESMLKSRDKKTCAFSDSLREIDVTKYENGERRTLNQDNYPLPSSEVWRLFDEEGCSVRILRPQKFSYKLRQLLSQLEQRFGTGAGANVYLTPKSSQGFASHYDDVDVFILQVSGSKEWKLHENPTDESLKIDLPSRPSGNLTQESIGPPTRTLTLDPGSLLYLPRGTIHQARACGDADSLHITISTAFQNSMAEYMKILLEGALDALVEESSSIRRSMPADYGSFLGIVHQDSTLQSVHARRAQFCQGIQQFMAQLVQHLPIDAAADQMFKRFLATQLPPARSSDSRKPSDNVEANSLVRLVRADIARLCVEDDMAVLYHCLHNDHAQHFNEDLAAVECELDMAPALEHLMLAYPDPSRVDALPELAASEAIDLVVQLVQEGILEVVGTDFDNSFFNNVSYSLKETWGV